MIADILTMKKVTMDVLIFFIFANQVLLIFGKVIVMHNLSPTDNMTFICISEDDGGALVWNFPTYFDGKIDGNIIIFNLLNNIIYN